MTKSKAKSGSPLQFVASFPMDESLIRLERGLRQHGYTFVSKRIDETVVQFEIHRNSPEFWLIATGTLQKWTTSDQTRITCQVNNATVNKIKTKNDPLVKFLVYLGVISVFIFPVLGMILPDSNLLFFTLTIAGWTLLFVSLGDTERITTNPIVHKTMSKRNGVTAEADGIHPTNKLISQFYDQVSEILSEEPPTFEVKVSGQMS